VGRVEGARLASGCVKRKNGCRNESSTELLAVVVMAPSVSVIRGTKRKKRREKRKGGRKKVEREGRKAQAEPVNDSRSDRPQYIESTRVRGKSLLNLFPLLVGCGRGRS
jgi:hypothetical protein